MTQRVFVIAEAGSNWRMGSPERDRAMAEQLIKAAAEAGADAVKFQVFRPETLYATGAGAPGYLGCDVAPLFADLSMPYEMIEWLANICESEGIELMATPFSVEAFRAIDPFVKRHKLGSYELSHLRLLECLAASGKPAILSVGGSTLEEIDWAVETFTSASSSDRPELSLMQCTLSYPTPLEDANVSFLQTLQERYNRRYRVGLSDHTREPLIAPLLAIGLGATVIEKHFTLHNALPGPDHRFAITADELKLLVTSIRQAERAVGDPKKHSVPSERELVNFALRALQTTRTVEAGEQWRENENFAILRPGNQPKGVHPMRLSEIEGRICTRHMEAGEGICDGDWK